MLYIKTKVRESSIDGLGVFADEFVAKGTIIWKYTIGFDLKFTKKEIERLPLKAQKYLYKYGWLSKKSGKYCFAIDNGKYFNHSIKPNSLSAYYKEEEEVITRAIKDINIGEEITDDYSTFEEGFDENKI